MIILEAALGEDGEDLYFEGDWTMVADNREKTKVFNQFLFYFCFLC